MANTFRMSAGFPDEVRDLTTRLGANIRIARRRRGLSVEVLAERMMVSPPTLRKLEKGDPTGSFGSFVLALWALGLAETVSGIADPATDAEGLRADLRRLPLRARRKMVRDDDF